jgi:hypothetical protein
MTTMVNPFCRVMVVKEVVDIAKEMWRRASSCNSTSDPTSSSSCRMRSSQHIQVYLPFDGYFYKEKLSAVLLATSRCKYTFSYLLVRMSDFPTILCTHMRLLFSLFHSHERPPRQRKKKLSGNWLSISERSNILSKMVPTQIIVA